MCSSHFALLGVNLWRIRRARIQVSRPSEITGYLRGTCNIDGRFIPLMKRLWTQWNSACHGSTNEIRRSLGFCGGIIQRYEFYRSLFVCGKVENTWQCRASRWAFMVSEGRSNVSTVCITQIKDNCGCLFIPLNLNSVLCLWRDLCHLLKGCTEKFEK